MTDYTRTLAMFKEYKKQVLVLFLLIQSVAILESIGIGMLLPLLQKVMGSTSSGNGLPHFLDVFLNYFPLKWHLSVLGGMLIGVVVLKSGARIVEVAYGARFTWRLLQKWSIAMLSRYLYGPYALTISKKQGVIVHNIIREPSAAAKFIELFLSEITQLVVILYIYVIMWFVNWRVTIGITIIVCIALIAVWRAASKYAMHHGHARLKVDQELTGFTSESVSAIRQVKTFSAEYSVLRQFRDTVAELSHMVVQFKIMSSLPTVFAELPAVLVIVGMLMFLTLTRGVEALPALLPTFGFFIVASHRLFTGASAIVKNRMLFLAMFASLKVVQEHVEKKHEREVLDHGEKIDSLHADIELRGISFQYQEGHPIISGLSIIIPRNKVTVLVGPSGSGKSTVADLLIGLYFPQEGSVLINGYDIRDINLEFWRKRIGFVSQETFLFNATIRENIRYGKPDASDEEVLSAAKQANIHDFVASLNEGYGTVVGDRGVMLSGGQRQRIAIARAIVRNPDFLIFDEATSAIDQETETEIFKSIEQLSKGKTVLIITHRLSTIRNADVVYKLDGGRIVVVGSDADVIEKNSTESYA